MPDLDRWRDAERLDSLEAVMLDPVSFAELGELPVTGGTLTEGYYTDARVCGTVDAVDFGGYVDLAAVRLVHRTRFSDGTESSEVLGTFFADKTPSKRKSGMESAELSLVSALWAMGQEETESPYAVAKGARAASVFEDICRRAGRKCAVLSPHVDYRFTEARAWDAGDTWLSHLFQLTEASGNRLDVDAEGRVTLVKYVAPGERAASLDLAWDDPLVLASGISRTSDELSVPSRSIAMWRRTEDGTETLVSAHADVAEGSRVSFGRRGYRVTAMHQVDSEDKPSKSAAQAEAARWLPEDSAPTTEWTVPCRWLDVSRGDVIRFLPPGRGEWVKCLVKAVESDLRRFTRELTLKEV